MRGERVEWPIAKDNGELATVWLGLYPLLFRLDNSQAGERKGGLCILGDVYCARTVSRLMDR